MAQQKTAHDWIKGKAIDNGFDACHITSASLPEDVNKRLQAFISEGHHGEMMWLDETKERRASPHVMWQEAKSAIVLGMNYGPDHNPLDNLKEKQAGNISVYARGRDYHEVIKGKLKQLAGQVAARLSCQVKVFVDTAPLMEKPLAAQAGLGWQGKHTNLVSRQFGSWLFLGVILTDELLHTDAPEDDHCGRCTSCLDICPTQCLTITGNGEEAEIEERLRAPRLEPEQPMFVSDPLQQTARVMVKDENLCVHCGLCAERCPTAAWDMQKSLLRFPKASDHAFGSEEQRKAG